MPISPMMTTSALFTLGTRGSPLALAQASEARRRLAEALGWEIERIALKIIRTSGDAIRDRPLAEAGGKGLFTKEIDAALIAGEIDAAVHSAKDLPSQSPEGVAIAAFLPREDVRDALISSYADTIEGLPSGATFGAASLRRQAQALRLRPDLKVELLRGNVETRLSKAEFGSDRRHSACSCRPQAAGPRPSRARRARDRRVPACRRPGRHRDHCAQRRRSRAASARAGLGRRDIRGACRRTRVLSRARGLVPHPDRRPRPIRSGTAQVQGRGATPRRLRALRGRRRGRGRGR